MSLEANLQLCLCRQGADGAQRSAASTDCVVIAAFVTLTIQAVAPLIQNQPITQQK